jgi:hypothetical protein
MSIRRHPLKDTMGMQPMWPDFTPEQVAFLKEQFPHRCLLRNETVEDHLRYCGKVELVEEIASHVSLPFRVATGEDLVDEDLDAIAEAEALKDHT